MRDEGPLQLGAEVILADTLDCDHIAAIALEREGEAREDPDAVNQDCACAACALIAAFLGAS